MKKRVLSLFLLAVGLVLTGCKFSTLLADGESSILITLPYGKSARAAADEKYSFTVDCYSGDSITETPLYSEQSESGKSISFNDVTPGTYTVLVRAYEYQNFNKQLYEGSDTKEVRAGRATTFAIKLGKSTENLCWIEFYQIEEKDAFYKPAVQTKPGVTVVEYSWFYYGKNISSGAKDNLLPTKILDSEYFQQEYNNFSYLTLITKFSDGSCAMSILNNAVQYSFITTAQKENPFDMTMDLYNKYLKETQLYGDIFKKSYAKLENPDDNTLNYQYKLAYNPTDEIFSNYPLDFKKAILQAYAIDDVNLSNPVATIPTEMSGTEGSFKCNFTGKLAPGSYNLLIKIEGENYNYIYNDLVTIKNGFKTTAEYFEYITNIGKDLSDPAPVRPEYVDILVSGIISNYSKINDYYNEENKFKLFWYGCSEEEYFATGSQTEQLLTDENFICYTEFTPEESFKETLKTVPTSKLFKNTNTALIISVLYCADEPIYIDSSYIYLNSSKEINCNINLSEIITIPEPVDTVYEASTYQELCNAINDGYSEIYITQSIVLSGGACEIKPSEKSVKIIRKGSFNTGAMFVIESPANVSFGGSDSQLTIDGGCNVTQDSATGVEGAIIHVEGGSLILNSNLLLQNNYNTVTTTDVDKKNGSGALGGAISTTSAITSNYSIELDGVKISNNKAVNGGAICLSGTPESIKILDAIISDNIGTNCGGAICLNLAQLRSYPDSDKDTLFIQKATINNNTSSRNGGGIGILKGNLDVIGTLTLTDNTAQNFGGGIYGAGNGEVCIGSVSIADMDFSGNTANDKDYPLIKGDVIHLGPLMNYTANKDAFVISNSIDMNGNTGSSNEDSYFVLNNN